MTRRRRRTLIAVSAALCALLAPASVAVALPAPDGEWSPGTDSAGIVRSAAPRTDGLGNTPAHTTPASAPVELAPAADDEPVSPSEGQPWLLVILAVAGALVAVVGAAVGVRHGRITRAAH